MTKLKIDDLETLCNEVIKTSLSWTGADENAIPGLKRIRTLSGLYLHQIKQVKTERIKLHKRIRQKAKAKSVNSIPRLDLLRDLFRLKI